MTLSNSGVSCGMGVQTLQRENSHRIICGGNCKYEPSEYSAAQKLNALHQDILQHKG